MVQLFYLRLFLGTETFFLLSVATDSKGGHGLKNLKKLGQHFQILMLCLQISSKQTNLMVSNP